MTLLPQQLTFAQLQTKWASILNVLLGNPVLASSQLSNIALTTGSNVVNHKLGRKLQGWQVARYHGSWAQIYDTQDSNSMPDLTLTLNASTGVIVDLVVW